MKLTLLIIGILLACHRASAQGTVYFYNHVPSAGLEHMIINPADPAALFAQDRDKQCSDEPTTLPRRPSPKGTDR